MSQFWGRIVLCVGLLGLGGCVSATPDMSTSNMTPPMRWDFRPDGALWTEASLAMLDGDAAVLTEIVPNDIRAWCPAYPEASVQERAAFWTGLLSALAKHESTWRPEAVGGGGRWFGLVQIAPATARGYGCAARSGTALQDGEANLRCALRIWANTVPRDGVISAGGDGIAADWGPMVMRNKREEMRAWISQQSYCRA
ncbi:transglycosylase SLT domain-containing protein [Rhodophyticola porphyridii]|uniref:Lytic transglycosylase n=1 Tax=Rhodophyticola porphyridii TaxID=1852017 RepID=A0A3L9Y348_9RHOB|nr:transglycosylase SLT domain-containing protein [Rhodophyticola porphyridii]RMA43214.1 lytic transglycosylase [Rhodophyticola porphyridii]